MERIFGNFKNYWKLKNPRKLKDPGKLKNFLIFGLIFSLVTFWIFSGWPGLGRKLSVPPAVKTVRASPDIEYLRPTAYTDAGGRTTNPANAYDNASVPPNDTYAETDTGADEYPSITYHTWQTPNYTYTALVLKVNRSSSGHSNDQWGIAYSTDGGNNWAYIDSMSSNNVARGTVQVILSASQDLSQLQVKIDSEKVLGGDGGVVDTYDIWTEGTYTVNNPPAVDSVNLTPDPINLSENTTTTVTCAATVSDADGGNTITSATATVYRSGVGYSCAANDNNCYPNITPSATSTSGNYFYATFTVDLWFHAEPTDEGDYATAQGWNTQTWQCYVIAKDNQGATATGTDSTPPDLNTLLALTVTPTIDYGTLAGGATSSASEIITVTTTGNVPIDVELSGTDMTSTSTTSTIPVGQQEYALSSVEYGSGTDLSGTPAPLELESVKPTTHPSDQSDDIYWRIGIPSGQDPGTYTGTTTVDAIAD